MTTNRQMQVFELIAVHGCSQAEAGKMLDPPISQSTVNRDINDLFDIHPELETVKEYLHESNGFGSNNEPFNIMSYESSMDYQVKAKF